jgi:hypothetical protein
VVRESRHLRVIHSDVLFRDARTHAPVMVPFMCVNESPCWVTVTPLAASDAISRSSFCILFKSAMPSSVAQLRVATFARASF